MRRTRLIMGMPVTLEVVGLLHEAAMDAAFHSLERADSTFSTYNPQSELERAKRGEIAEHAYSADLKEILARAEDTRVASHGFFDIGPFESCDPSGIVKGWAISRAGNLLRDAGHTDFYIDAGGDVELSGCSTSCGAWRVGIRSPFDSREIVKVLAVSGAGVATSGTYERGAHVYNPLAGGRPVTEVVSLTVVGPSAYEADRFATAAFAMGLSGIGFIEECPGLEGYQIDQSGKAVFSRHFDQYVAQ